jgi:lysophospholipase
MGGHLMLRALVERRITADAAILVAPMLGLKSPLGARWSEALARGLGRLGNPARPAWRGNERPATLASRQLLLTHDAERYQDELWWHKQQPDLWTGPPSWRWLIEAFRSTRMLRANPALRSMTVPILALIADADGLVDPNAAVSVLLKLPDVRFVRFGPEAAHELLREVDQVRDRALAEIDDFLAAHAARS